MEPASIDLAARLSNWRAANWPPKDCRRLADERLPIYVGSYETVHAFAETLSEVMMEAADHIYEKCRGRKPQWMRVPKVLFGVERLTLTKGVAKASKRFRSVEELTASKCGDVDEEGRARLQAWAAATWDGELIAHKPFTGLRAYVFVNGQERPERVCFYESGLVVAVTPHFIVQDHQAVKRKRRSDAYEKPLARTTRGWLVYGREKSENDEIAGGRAEEGAVQTSQAQT